MQMQMKMIPNVTQAFIHSLFNPLIWVFVLVGNLTLMICAYAFFRLEKGLNPQVHELFDAIWWAFCTVTTVGYGDIAPVTQMGRLVGIVLMLTGATTFVGFTAVLVSGILSRTAETIIDNEKVTIREYKHIIQEIKSLHAKIDEHFESKR